MPPIPPPPVPPPPVPPPPTRQNASGQPAKHPSVAGIFTIAILVFLAGLVAYATHVESGRGVPSPTIPAVEVISNAPPTASTPAAESPELEARSAPKFLDVLAVGTGETVSVGDKADDVFPLVQKYETGDPITANDPRVPGSLFVIHTYKIQQTIYALGFGRLEADGPYRLSTIREE